MGFADVDAMVAAPVQKISLNKTASITSVAAIPFQVFHLAGNPGAGTLAGTSTTTGVVPTDATAGFPPINAFGGGATGHITRATFNNSVPCTIQVYDLLWKGGAYAFNANTSGQTPTSFSSRVPGGTDFKGLELWIEQVTAATGIQSVAITYNDQGGASSVTPTTSQGTAGIVGRMTQIPLASGDSGLTGVTGVVGSVASVGTFNVLVLRPLCEARINIANAAVTLDFTGTGNPEVFADSALFYIVTPDSTATGISSVKLDIRNA
jgi:hypothetical protein